MDTEKYPWKDLKDILKGHLSTTLLAQLQDELPTYKALAQDLDASTLPSKFFCTFGLRLPAWKSVFALIGLELPSSAPAERGFSIFQQFFKGLPKEALQDLIEMSVMMRYNHRKRTEAKFT